MQFLNPYSPYCEAETENMEIWFERYKNDPENTMVFNGLVLKKIIYRCNLCIRDEWTTHIIFVPDISLKIGDILIDENGSDFTVKSVEMIRFINRVPEWYINAAPIVVSGKNENIGSYLRVKSNSES